MSSDEMKEAIDLIAEFARTRMLVLDARQQDLIRKFCKAMFEYTRPGGHEDRTEEA